MPNIDDLCAQLRAQGRRVTPQRRAIIQVLLEDDDIHPTAEQIFTRVRDTMPDTSPATIYNTLHELVEIGILSELDLGLGGRHYDLIMTDHAHLICLGCSQVVEFECAMIEEAQEQIAKTYGYRLTNHRHDLFGYCPACRGEGRGAA